MATDEFKKRTGILYEALKEMGGALPVRKPSKTSFTLAQGGYRFVFDDGTEVSLGLSKYVSGMPKGEFTCSAGVSLSDGRVVSTLAKVSAAEARQVDNPWLVGSSWYLVPRLFAKAPDWDYRFVAGVDPEKLTKQVMADIKTYLFPVIQAFVEDYSKAADIFLTGEVQQVTFSRPFATGLSILNLAGRLDEAEALVARAASMQEKFHDYSPKKAEKLISLFRKKR